MDDITKPASLLPLRILASPLRLVKLVSCFPKDSKHFWVLDLAIHNCSTLIGNTVLSPPLSSRTCQDNLALRQKQHIGGRLWSMQQGRLEIW